jgi:hypothetical protein
MLAYLFALALAASPNSAAPKQETQLVIDVKPAQVVIYLDNRKIGTASKVHTVKVEPGDHRIKLTLNKDSSEDIVTVKKGQKKVWEFDMTDSGDPSQKPPATTPEQHPDGPDPTK